MQLSDFIPPIVFKVLRRVERKLNAANVRHHPFDCVPHDIPVRRFMDVGANVGDVTEAALKTYPGVEVICFEPVSSTFATLQKRVEPFGNQVSLNKQALSDAAGLVEINLTSFHGANSISSQSAFHKDLNPHVFETGRETIETVRLDDIGDRYGYVDVMKIDVEGHELNVLKGGAEFIRSKVDVVIVELSFMRDSSWADQSVSSIMSFMHDLGFRLINIFDIHNANNPKHPNLMCVQVDAVFRRLDKLEN